MLKKTIALMLVFATAAAASAPRPSAPSLAATRVPPRFQGVWGRNGRCDRAGDRLRITDRRAAWGAGPFRPVIYLPTDHTVRWDSEYDAATLEIGGRPGILVYNKEGGNMPDAREGYAKCGAALRRVAWPRP